jgi:hypothetical protein
MSKIEVNTIDTQCGANLTVGAACKSVTIAGNDIRSNNYKASDGGIIISQSGTNITLGASGDTINLAAGATQSGFGRTGTVDWCTTAKTAPFTAVSGNGYFVNTTSGQITVTLPATPSAGDIVSIADYTNTWQTNKVNIARNGSNMGGVAACASLTTEGQSVTFVYVDGTEGWKSVQDSTSNVTGAIQYIQATGGTITYCGDYKIHTFTADATFCVSALSDVSPTRNNVDYLVVAGGAGGGNQASGGGYSATGGGGGAGGFRESHTVPISGCYTASPLASATPLPVSVQAYPVTVGAGGTGGTSPGQNGGAGGNSIFSTITSTGGGGGGRDANGGVSGGSGGGSGGETGPGAGGSGNTPPVSPPQGNNGGPGGAGGPAYGSGGGGGATAVGNGGGTASSGSGGNGATTSVTGSPVAYSGGGGGGAFLSAQKPGGTGGGGSGAYPGATSVAGTTNTGGGGGGGGTGPGPTGCQGAAGGSGVVIIRYRYQ